MYCHKKRIHYPCFRLRKTLDKWSPRGVRWDQSQDAVQKALEKALGLETNSVPWRQRGAWNIWGRLLFRRFGRFHETSGYFFDGISMEHLWNITYMAYVWVSSSRPQAATGTHRWWLYSKGNYHLKNGLNLGQWITIPFSADWWKKGWVVQSFQILVRNLKDVWRMNMGIWSSLWSQRDFNRNSLYRGSGSWWVVSLP